MNNQPNNSAKAEAIVIAKRVSTNFKTLRENKRALARYLVISSAVEGEAFAKLQMDVKKEMNWTRLASDEQAQMNVFFGQCRVIDGAWSLLPVETQKAFVEGHIIFSTLAKKIKDDEKAALAEAAKGNAPDVPAPEPKGDADADAAPSELAQKLEQAKAASAESAPAATIEGQMQRMAHVLNALGVDDLKPAELDAMTALFDAIVNKRNEYAAKLVTPNQKRA